MYALLDLKGFLFKDNHSLWANDRDAVVSTGVIQELVLFFKIALAYRVLTISVN